MKKETKKLLNYGETKLAILFGGISTFFAASAFNTSDNPMTKIIEPRLLGITAAATGAISLLFLCSGIMQQINDQENERKKEQQKKEQQKMQELEMYKIMNAKKYPR